MLLLGDCNHWLKEIKDNSIDLIVTDPPYGLVSEEYREGKNHKGGFMGKDWDKALVSTETWKECYRVLKEGKLAFVMCSPRQDVLSRMIINLQDAGFRTNYTSIYWTFASGFPKAANISKLMDKKPHKTILLEIKQFLIKAVQNSNKSRTQINKECGFNACGYLSTALDEWGRNVPPEHKWFKMKQVLGFDNTYDEIIREGKREIVGDYIAPDGNKRGASAEATSLFFQDLDKKNGFKQLVTKPATEEAKKMEGAYVGFQPKPAVEVILVVSKGKTLTWLDEVKIPASCEPDNNVSASPVQVSGSIQDASLSTTLYNRNYTNHDHHEDDPFYNPDNELFRWLASAQKQMSHFSNVPLDENVLYESQDSRSCCPSCLRFYDALTRWSKVYVQGAVPSLSDALGYIHDFSLEHKHIPENQYNDHLSNVDDLNHILQGMVSGNSLAYNNDPRNTITKRFPANLLVSDNTLGDYSRYFSLDQWADKTLPFLICPKASKAERNKGCEDLPAIKNCIGDDRPSGQFGQRLDGRPERYSQNHHPTVKPLKLMSYLITMGSREGDLVLDPFCGSGTVLIAADQLHRKWLGIERNPEYAEIIKKRLMVPLSQLKLTIY